MMLHTHVCAGQFFSVLVILNEGGLALYWKMTQGMEAVASRFTLHLDCFSCPSNPSQTEISSTARPSEGFSSFWVLILFCTIKI